MPTALMPEGRQRYYNNDGTPCAGGKVYTYDAGTTNPRVTYADEAGTTPNPNPLTLDAHGEAVIFWSGAYKVDVKQADGVQVTGYPVDNLKTDPAGLWGLVALLLTSAGAAMIGFTLNAAGSILRTLQSRLAEEVRITDFTNDTAGATDISAAVANAVAKLGNFGTIIFPEGTFKFNIDFGDKRINMRGAGMGKTAIMSYAAAGAPITYSGNSSWDRLEISDLTISGAGIRRDLGLAFGVAGSAAATRFAGRVTATRVKFSNLDKCVLKRYGNIGNQFHQCVFDDANFHWYATGSTSPALMHAGADSFRGCHFSAAQLASIYVNSPVSGSGGLYFDAACVFEANPGFLLFCKEFNGQWVPGIAFDGSWNESNATAGNVNIDGVNYAVTDFYFRLARQVLLRNMRVTGIQLTESIVHADHCSMDGLTLTKDARSALISDRQFADSSKSLDHYVSSISSANRPAGGFASVFVSKPRSLITRAYAALGGESFARGSVTLGGTSSHIGVVVPDGILFDTCNEYTINASEIVSAGTFALTAEKYYVTTIDAKLVSGVAPAMYVGNTTFVMPSFDLANTTWRSFVALTNTLDGNGLGTVRLRFSGAAGGSAVVRVSALQIVEFSNLQDALAFIDMGCYVPPSDLPRRAYNTAAPTAGTWNVGDTVVNSVPAVGSPKSWRCTVAGTPGTWVSEGVL